MLHYELLLSEEKINLSDLPKEIKQKITTLKVTIGRSSKSPDNKTFKDSVEKQDLAIANDIQTWIDSQEPTETEDQKKAREAKEAKEKADKEAADNEASTKAKEMEMRNAIVTKMNAHPQRAIERADLTAILGRNPADKEKIGDLKLYRVYLTQKWKAS